MGNERPFGWLHDLPAGRVIEPTANASVAEITDFCSSAAIRTKARAILDVILFDQISKKPGADSEGISDGTGSISPPSSPKPLIFVSHGISGVIIKQVCTLIPISAVVHILGSPLTCTSIACIRL